MKTTFKIIKGILHEYNENNNCIHRKHSNGYEVWFDENNNLIHTKYSDGFEVWRKYDENNNCIHREYNNNNLVYN